MMNSSKTNVELLADILADERANTNAVKQEYLTLRHSFTETASAIQQFAQAQGIGLGPNERVIDLLKKLVAKLIADLTFAVAQAEQSAHGLTAADLTELDRCVEGWFNEGQVEPDRAQELQDKLKVLLGPKAAS
jgi:hypothetical protein